MLFRNLFFIVSIIISSFIFADCNDGMGVCLSLDGGNLDYVSDADIAGFQFGVTGVSVTSAGGGAAEAAGFTVSVGNNTVLGFSLQGATIPAGEGVLVVLDVTGAGDDACLEDVIISDSGGEALGVNISDCEDVELLSLVLGDINFDGSIDVLDVVVQVNAILQPGDLSSSEFTAADINGDGVLNVMDVVLLVNLILGN